MNGAISPDRLLAFPCTECLRVVRIYREKNPGIETEELIASIKTVEADAGSFDFEAAISLDADLADGVILDGAEYYRACITTVVTRYQPAWARAMSQGRERFANSLTSDMAAVFTAAGIADEPAPPDFVDWWDGLSGAVRLERDLNKMLQARAAERLTMEMEEQKLEELGLSDKPKWIGLDDNFAGYDVLSFEMKDNKKLPLMIEVKSTVQSPLRFILTRNEWDTALDVGERYIFHVWDMAPDTPRLYPLTVNEVMPHVPQDGDAGKWTAVQIPLKIEAS